MTGSADAKVGLDDYLCAHPVTTLDELPRLPLKHPLFKRAAAWWREWSKRAEEGPARPQASVLELLQRPDTTRVLHPAQLPEGIALRWRVPWVGPGHLAP